MHILFWMLAFPHVYAERNVLPILHLGKKKKLGPSSFKLLPPTDINTRSYHQEKKLRRGERSNHQTNDDSEIKEQDKTCGLLRRESEMHRTGLDWWGSKEGGEGHSYEVNWV